MFSSIFRRPTQTTRALFPNDRVPDNELVTLERITTDLTMRAGETLFEQGSQDGQVVLVAAGRLAAERDGVTLGEIGQGSFAGELASLSGRRRNASVIAIDDSVVLSFEPDDFSTLLDECPTIARIVYKGVFQRTAATGQLSEFMTDTPQPLGQLDQIALVAGRGDSRPTGGLNR